MWYVGAFSDVIWIVKSFSVDIYLFYDNRMLTRAHSVDLSCLGSVLCRLCSAQPNLT